MRDYERKRLQLPLFRPVLLALCVATSIGHMVDCADVAAPYRPRADRRLTTEQIDELLKLSDTLINGRNRWLDRERAAMRLGRSIAHKYCIPSLLAVLRDESDDAHGVRQRCVLSLSWIADRRVLDFLIEALLDHDQNVAIQAPVQLEKLTLQHFEYQRFDPNPESAMREQQYRKWHDWWELHRKDATIYWFRALLM